MKRSSLWPILSPLLLALALTACSDGRTPLDLGPFPDPNPNEPQPSGTDVTLDFSEFGAGDTITTSQGVTVGLGPKGDGCADAVIAFDSSNPPGVTRDDLDLGTPNQAFGGPGVGVGGEDGPFRNDRPLGMLLVIQEDPAREDDNPSLIDDCDQGGTVVFDFSGLSSTGVGLSSITVLDVDDAKQARSEFRLYGLDEAPIAVVNPPVTRPNGVATMDFGGVMGILRLEIDQTVSIAVARMSILVPEVDETAG